MSKRFLSTLQGYSGPLCDVTGRISETFFNEDDLKERTSNIWPAGPAGQRGSGAAGQRGSGAAGQRGSGAAGQRGSGAAGQRGSGATLCYSTLFILRSRV